MATPPSLQCWIARPSEVKVKSSGQSGLVDYREVLTVRFGQWNDRLKEVRQLVDRHISSGYVQPDQRRLNGDPPSSALRALILLPFFVTVSVYTTVTLVSWWKVN